MKPPNRLTKPPHRLTKPPHRLTKLVRTQVHGSRREMHRVVGAEGLVHDLDERTGHHLSVAMSLRHHEARHRAAPEVEYERLRALRP